jgi:hypothetical protein
MFKSVIKIIVGIGTTMTVSGITKGLQDKYVPKKSGFVGLCQDASLAAARYAITYKTVNDVDKFIDKDYTSTIEDGKDVYKKAAEAINEIKKRRRAYTIDISTKEETSDGETNTEDHAEANAN